MLVIEYVNIINVILFPFSSFVFTSIYLKLPEIPIQKIWVEVKLKLDVTGIE